MNRFLSKVLVLIAATALTLPLAAEGKSSSGKSSKSASGTGSKSSSTQVRGHVTKKGQYVAPHKRSTPDKSKANNWSTKGNTNPSTGKKGTR